MNIAVIGEGGHSKVVLDLIRQRKEDRLVAILDDKYKEPFENAGIWKGPIASAFWMASREEDLKFVVAIGSNETRKNVIARLGLSPADCMTLIHETAVVSPSAVIGCGTVVMAYAVVHADARVGDHAILNTGAIVEHDSRVGDFAHVCPRAALTGAVGIGEGAMVGAGSVVIPGRSVGSWAVVGAGATVTRDIPSYSTAVGTPATVIKRYGA